MANDLVGIRKLKGAFDLFLISVNVLQINYVIADAIGVSGQLVSAFIATYAGANFIGHFIIRRRRIALLPDRRSSQIFYGYFIVVGIIPAISFLFLHAYNADFSGFIFWSQRVIINFATMALGAVACRPGPSHGLGYLAKLIFILTLAVIVISYFYPIESLVLFTAGDLDLVEGLDYGRAFGSFLQANVASEAACLSYAVWLLVLSTGTARAYLVEKLIYDVAFLYAVALTGSRAGAILAACLFLLSVSMYSRKTQKFWVGLVLLFAVISPAVAPFVSDQFTEGEGPQTRIFNLTDENASESTALRGSALKDAIAVIDSNLWTGISMGAHKDHGLGLLPHNMYVYYVLTNGLLLGMAFPVYLFSIWSAARGLGTIGKASAIMLVFMSLFTHNLLDSKQLPFLIIMIILLRDGARRRDCKGIGSDLSA